MVKLMPVLMLFLIFPVLSENAYSGAFTQAIKSIVKREAARKTFNKSVFKNPATKLYDVSEHNTVSDIGAIILGDTASNIVLSESRRVLKGLPERELRHLTQRVNTIRTMKPEEVPVHLYDDISLKVYEIAPEYLVQAAMKRYQYLLPPELITLGIRRTLDRRIPLEYKEVLIELTHVRLKNGSYIFNNTDQLNREVLGAVIKEGVESYAKKNKSTFSVSYESGGLVFEFKNRILPFKQRIDIKHLAWTLAGVCGWKGFKHLMYEEIRRMTIEDAIELIVDTCIELDEKEREERFHEDNLRMARLAYPDSEVSVAPTCKEHYCNIVRNNWVRDLASGTYIVAPPLERSPEYLVENIWLFDLDAI